MIPPMLLPAMAVVALLEAGEDLCVSGVVIFSFFGTEVASVLAVVVHRVLVKTSEGHEFAFSSSKLIIM